MNPLIITAFTIGGAIAGHFLCALMTAGKVGDVQIATSELAADRDWWEKAAKDERDFWTGAAELWDADRANLTAAHSRTSDALTTKNERINRALGCVTENSAHVGKKMARILRGDA